MWNQFQKKRDSKENMLVLRAAEVVASRFQVEQQQWPLNRHTYRPAAAAKAGTAGAGQLSPHGPASGTRFLLTSRCLMSAFSDHS